MKKIRLSTFDIVVTFMLAILALIFVYPIWTVIVAAFSEPLEYVKNPLALFPARISLYNFRMLFTSRTIWRGYGNTLLYVLVGTLINVSMTFVMAYGLSMKELPCKRLISFLVTITLFFSGGMIPTYLIVKSYGLLDRIWALVLPGAIGTYNLMITRTYLSGQIPGELLEAAEVDGAGPLRIFLVIVTPLSRPILAVLTLFYAAGHWNGWYDAMIYLRDNAKYPLQLILRSMLINEETMGVMATEAGQTSDVFYTITLNFAVILVAILPLMVIFPFVQRFFVKGVMIGAIKG